VDFGFDETKVTSKEELVRMRSKKEIQHVRHEALAGAGAGNGSAHAPLPIIEMSGHDLPADEFIAPKRSSLAPKEPKGGGGVRAC
jgi:hypothetical protein